MFDVKIKAMTFIDFIKLKFAQLLQYENLLRDKN